MFSIIWLFWYVYFFLSAIITFPLSVCITTIFASAPFLDHLVSCFEWPLLKLKRSIFQQMISFLQKLWSVVELYVFNCMAVLVCVFFLSTIITFPLSVCITTIFASASFLDHLVSHVFFDNKMVVLDSLLISQNLQFMLRVSYVY